MESLKEQVGGNHYTKLKIQPIEYILANKLNFLEGSVVKYISRYKNKGGLKDLLKIKQCIDILIEDVYGIPPSKLKQEEEVEISERD